VEPDQLDVMFAEADSTKSGAIGFPEFMSMMSRRMKQVYLITVTFFLVEDYLFLNFFVDFQ
jgi:hypothetical protein